MSQKFNAKNLSYDTSLPPFLAALRSQNPQSSSSANPLLASNRRRGAKRSGSEEAEDAPLVVDAGGNVLDATVEGDGTVRYEGGDDGAGAEGGVGGEAGGTGGEKAAAVPMGRKRRARVVGAGREEEEEGPRRGKGGGREEGAKPRADGSGGTGEKSSGVKPASKTKKKAKKIKLSFDDEGT